MFSMMRTFIIIFKTILQLEQILSMQRTSGDTIWSISQRTTGMLMVSKKFIGESLVHAESSTGSLMSCSLVKLHLKKSNSTAFCSLSERT